MRYKAAATHMPAYAQHVHNQRSSDVARPERANKNMPWVIDVIGCGKELTVCGHIDLLRLMPLHHLMHRELLQTYKEQPGHYRGKYNEDDQSCASVLDYGNGYLAIHFIDDITRPELSEFLLRKGWRMLSAHFALNKDRTLIYEKWTNCVDERRSGRHRKDNLNGYAY